MMGRRKSKIRTQGEKKMKKKTIISILKEDL